MMSNFPAHPTASFSDFGQKTEEFPESRFVHAKLFK